MDTLLACTATAAVVGGFRVCLCVGFIPVQSDACGNNVLFTGLYLPIWHLVVFNYGSGKPGRGAAAPRFWHNVC